MQPDEKWIWDHAGRIHDALEKSTILELGGGEGRDTIQLVNMGCDVVVTDLRHEALLTCAANIPAAMPVQINLSTPLPFPDMSFSVILASLSLHYFPWETTVNIVGEIRRCISDGGLFITRLNSTRDFHHGAGSSNRIEDNFFQVRSRTKRFFDQESIAQLFRDWRVISMEEKVILRYKKPKSIWEVVLYAD